MAFLQLFLVVGTTCLLALKAYLLRARHLRLCPSRIDPFTVKTYYHQALISHLSSTTTTTTTHKLLSHKLLSTLSHPKDIKISVR